MRKQIKCITLCEQKWGSPTKHGLKITNNKNYRRRGFLVTHTSTGPLEGKCSEALCKGKYGHLPCLAVAMMT